MRFKIGDLITLKKGFDYCGCSNCIALKKTPRPICEITNEYFFVIIDGNALPFLKEWCVIVDEIKKHKTHLPEFL